jgi:dCMP deaminase
VRVDWVTYGFNLARVVREQSTCIRRKVSCIIFHDKRPIATGFNGVPSGCPHPTEPEHCSRNRLQIAPGQQAAATCCIHAEANAAALVRLTPWHGQDLWAVSWTQPCHGCQQELHAVGVQLCWYLESYPGVGVESDARHPITLKQWSPAE